MSIMRLSMAALVCSIGLGLVSCTNDTSRRDDAARKAGREAYRASRNLKKDAKQAERELRSAGKQFRQGWDEAKHEKETERRQ